MKHLKNFENYISESSKIKENLEEDKIDIMQDNFLDTDNMTLTIYYDPDNEWDRKSDYLRDLKYLAKNENDPMSVDIDDALEPHGLMIDTTKKHNFDVDSDTIEIFLTKLVK